MLSEEHKKLLEKVEKERLSEDAFDLPKMRREQHDLVVQKLPERNYGHFTEYILTKSNVRIHQTQNEKIRRIERLPKYIRDISKTNHLPLYQLDEAIRFTSYGEYATNGIDRISEDHPLFKLGMILTRKENEKLAVERYMVYYPMVEPLTVEAYVISLTDGTGKELADGSIRSAVIKASMELRDEVRHKREGQLNRVMGYLDKTFKKQIDDLIERRDKYEQENEDNRNSALINQMDVNLIDLEMRKERRLSLVERQKNIGMKPPKRLIQLEVVPRGKPGRVFSIDYKIIIEEYERQNGRGNLKMFNPLALVDFYSERYNGKPRYIIVTEDEFYWPSEEYYEDLHEIADQVYIYVVRDKKVIEERKLDQLLLVD